MMEYMSFVLICPYNYSYAYDGGDVNSPNPSEIVILL